MDENAKMYAEELRTIQVFAALHPHISKYAAHGWPQHADSKRKETNVHDTCGGPEFWIEETLYEMGLPSQQGRNTLYNAVFNWMYPKNRLKDDDD